MLKNLFWIFYLMFLYLTTSLWALEDNFEVVKNPYPKPIVVNDGVNSCTSWDLRNNVIGGRYVKFESSMFNYNNDIYVVYYSGRKQIIKKLNKTTKTLEDFISFNTHGPSRVCSCMMETANDCYIFVFYDGGKVAKVSLKTQQIEKDIGDIVIGDGDTLHLSPIEAVAYNNKIYTLYNRYNFDTYNFDRYYFSVLNPDTNEIEQIMQLPKYNNCVPEYTTLSFYKNTLKVYGYYFPGGNYSVTPRYLSCNIDITNYSMTLDAGNKVYEGCCRKSLTYQSNGKTYNYISSFIDLNNANSFNGFFVTGEEFFVFRNNDGNIRLESLFADGTGFYTGYTHILDRTRIGFFKRSVDGKTAGNPLEIFYIDDNINATLTQNYSIMTTEIDGQQQMVVLGLSDDGSMNSSYDGPHKKLVLYFLPTKEVENCFYVDENGFNERVLNPKGYPTNRGQFTYKFAYTNYQNKAPSSSPVLYIYNNGQSIKSDGFTMNPVDYNDTNYTDGKIYSYTTSLSDIGTITTADNYSYRIKIGDSLSREYRGPFFTGNGVITDHENTFIVPTRNINPNTDISIQMKYEGDNGVTLATGYPRVLIYKNTDLVNPIEIKGSTYTVLSPIENSDNGYRTSIGKFPLGDYTYKIIAKNEFGLESSVSGNFSSIVNDPIITEYEDTFITPSENIDIRSDINIQMTYTGDDSVKLASEYPRVLIYNNNNPTVPIEINSSTYTVLSPIEDSDNGYRANIGKLPIGNYTYKIIAKNEFGLESSVSNTFIVESIDTSICYNAPNPFNPNKTTTTIRFNTNQDETVKIKIYSLNSKLVFEDSFDAKVGPNDYVYKGKDGNGNNLYNGVYLCVIEKKGGKVKCKIAIVK